MTQASGTAPLRQSAPTRGLQRPRPAGMATRLIICTNISYTNHVWEVEYTEEFRAWYEPLAEDDQDAVIGRVELLEQAGPSLGRPSVDNVHQSRHPNMKELRAERGLRVLFAFDPRRFAILLIGGDKSPDDPKSATWNRCRSPTISR